MKYLLDASERLQWRMRNCAKRDGLGSQWYVLFWLALLVALPTVQGQPTTVQLPTLDQFTVGTTVWVPDGGSALLGGVDSYQSGSSSRGVPMLGRLPGIGRAFNNRAFGSNTNTRRARVKVQIIDLQEMDRQLLGTAAARRVRERMGVAYSGDDLFGVGTSDGYSLDGGGLVRGKSIEDPTSARAKYLSQNMGKASTVSRAEKAVRRSSQKVRTAKAGSNTSEPPLILKGGASRKE